MRIMSRHTGKPPSSAGHNGDIRRHGGGGLIGLARYSTTRSEQAEVRDRKWV